MGFLYAPDSRRGRLAVCRYASPLSHSFTRSVSIARLPLGRRRANVVALSVERLRAKLVAEA